MKLFTHYFRFLLFTSISISITSATTVIPFEELIEGADLIVYGDISINESETLELIYNGSESRLYAFGILHYKGHVPMGLRKEAKSMPAGFKVIFERSNMDSYSAIKNGLWLIEYSNLLDVFYLRYLSPGPYPNLRSYLEGFRKSEKTTPTVEP
ncbi:hypothetical protein [Rubellicoccus peritrichatus]|uniref:Uncharacterized protein n=1 Tax=Rubellicoccus peritrichatus TaxID=3080537 RepID=A0AAQ3LF71_9BACT|nr:hypothetical protein [Puniceicoccus sp. CR14]WOO42583.1 hypothetical protein RZN69_05730 [Puniceicoccus sp. CR14]